MIQYIWVIKVKSGIYKITNLVNGKVYIGQSVNLYKRFSHHMQDLRNKRHANKHLQSAWNRYGEHNFNFEIIEICNEKILDMREQYWIKYFKSTNRKFGYNLEDGGNKNKHLTEEVKKKIGESNKGHKMPEEVKQKLRECHLGKPLSLEVRKKLSMANKGKHRTEKQKEMLRKFHKGKPLSEETKQKLSESHKILNKKQVIEIRAKFAVGNYKQRQLAVEYNCCNATINNIVHYKGGYRKGN